MAGTTHSKRLSHGNYPAQANQLDSGGSSTVANLETWEPQLSPTGSVRTNGPACSMASSGEFDTILNSPATARLAPQPNVYCDGWS